MRNYIAEGLGTFALLFCGTGAIIVNQETNGVIGHAGIAATFGMVVMCMIYAFGEISGAQFNPAVTIGFAVSGRFSKKEIIPYILGQSIGAFAASGLLAYLFPLNATLGATIPAGDVMQSFVLETILTFFLMMVILNVSQGAKETGMFAGIAIGGTVMLEAMFAGPICGASMNPIRSLAPALVSGHWEYIWIYLSAPVLGAMMAAMVWRWLHPNIRNK